MSGGGGVGVSKVIAEAVAASMVGCGRKLGAHHCSGREEAESSGQKCADL